MSNGNSDLTFRALPVLPFPSPKNRCEAHKLPYIGGKGGPSQSLKPSILSMPRASGQQPLDLIFHDYPEGNTLHGVHGAVK
jgi:hypothetical protein